jgi:hypothetical protein
MRMAVWNELPEDTAGPASGPPGVAISVPATDFLGTLGFGRSGWQSPLRQCVHGRSGCPGDGMDSGFLKSGDYSNFTDSTNL